MESFLDDPNYPKLKEMWERCQSSPERTEKLNSLLKEMQKAANSQYEIFSLMGNKEGIVQFVYNNQVIPIFYPPVIPNQYPVFEGQNQQIPNNQEQISPNQLVSEASYSYYDSYTADYNEYDEDDQYYYSYSTVQSSSMAEYPRDDYYSSEFTRQEDDIDLNPPQVRIQAPLEENSENVEPLSSGLAEEEANEPVATREIQEEVIEQAETKELPEDDDFEKATAIPLPEEPQEYVVERELHEDVVESASSQPIQQEEVKQEEKEAAEPLNGLKFDENSRTIIKEGVGKIRFIFPLDSSRFKLKSNMILDKKADISMLKDFATFCPTEVTFENFDVNGKNNYDEILQIFCRKAGVKLVSYDEQDKRLTFRVNKLNQYPITVPQL